MVCVTAELTWQWCTNPVAAAKGVGMIVHDEEQFVQWERINEEEEQHLIQSFQDGWKQIYNVTGRLNYLQTALAKDSPFNTIKGTRPVNL